MTPQEVKLWVRLRALRAHGFHIRRQVPREGYVLDFACIDRKIIIEVDGATHGGIADETRDRHLAASGFRTLRVSNQEVGANLDGVVESIYLALSAAETARPTRPR